MTLQLTLSPETEVQLRQQAALSGQDIDAFVLQAVTEKLAEAESQLIRPAMQGDDWAKKLQAIIALHPVVSHFVDDSRESIYAGRGE
jgi:hypothetical protein